MCTILLYSYTYGRLKVVWKSQTGVHLGNLQWFRKPCFVGAAILRVLIAQPEPELLSDWRFIANQFVLATSSLTLTTSSFFQQNTCDHSPYVTSSLTRGWVCRLQLLQSLASALLFMSESRGTHDHILLFQTRDSPKLEGQVPVFLSPKNGVAQLYSQALGSLFIASYDSHGYGGVVRPRFHTGPYRIAHLHFLFVM
jgi:hypothetical protein